MSFSSQRHTVGAESSTPKQREKHDRPSTDAAIADGASNHALSSALGGAPIDSRVRAEMEARFGESFGDVRIHNDADANRSAAELEAKAYTVGNSIAFAADRYAPHTADGKRLLAHELAHVIQQRRGGAAPDESLRAEMEGDATAVSDAAVSGAPQIAVNGASAPAVMLDKDDDRRRRSKGFDDDGRDKKVERDRAKAQKHKREQERAAAGKDETQIQHERAEKKLRALEKDATAPGAKSRSPKTKQKALNRYEDVIKDAGGTQLQKNKRKGAFDEAQRTPSEVAGRAQEKYVAGGRQLPNQELRPGQEHYAQPDYSIYRRHADRTVECMHVNLKSDKVHLQSPAKAVATARYNTDQAVRNAAHLAEGESIIVSYAHTPDPETQLAMLAEHFRAGSPIKEVRFGTTTHTPASYEALAAKLAKSTPKGKPRSRSKSKAKSGGKKASKSKNSGAKKKAKAKSKARTEAENKTAGKKSQRAKSQSKESGAKEGAAKTPRPEVDESVPKSAETKVAGSQTQTPTSTDTAKPVETPKTTAEAKAVETPKVAPKIETVPKGVTPKEVVGGALGIAGGLAAVSGVKDIAKDIKEGHVGTAAVKTGLLGLSFVGEAAPPLFAAGVISNYWGERHESIQEDSFAVGDVVSDAVESVPLIGDVPYLPEVTGGIASAGTAVAESVGYTLKDMGDAVVDGAQTVGGLAEDAYDWLTEPVISDEEMQRLLKQMKDD